MEGEGGSEEGLGFLYGRKAQRNGTDQRLLARSCALSFWRVLSQAVSESRSGLVVAAYVLLNNLRTVLAYTQNNPLPSYLNLI